MLVFISSRNWESGSHRYANVLANYGELDFIWITRSNQGALEWLNLSQCQEQMTDAFWMWNVCRLKYLWFLVKEDIWELFKTRAFSYKIRQPFIHSFILVTNNQHLVWDVNQEFAIPTDEFESANCFDKRHTLSNKVGQYLYCSNYFSLVDIDEISYFWRMFRKLLIFSAASVRKCKRKKGIMIDSLFLLEAKVHLRGHDKKILSWNFVNVSSEWMKGSTSVLTKIEFWIFIRY